MKITAPAAADLAGEHVSTYGATTLRFKDGVAEIDADQVGDGLRAYLLGAGYTVDGDRIDQAADAPPAIDSRDVETEMVGTPLRDAAVDPQPEDFLAPVNAGEADPHGPQVVAPGIHAEGERAVRPGLVHVEDPAQQEKDEKEHAAALLIDQKPMDEVTALAVPDQSDRGPLELSDPGSAAEGVRLAAEAAEARQEAGEPKAGASRADWVAWAKGKGAPDSELATLEAGGLSRDDLRARYGS